MSLIQRIKDKVKYEYESYLMAGEHLRKISEEMPYPKGYWHMTPEEIQRWRRTQGKIDPRR